MAKNWLKIGRFPLLPYHGTGDPALVQTHAAELQETAKLFLFLFLFLFLLLLCGVPTRPMRSRSLI